MKWLIPTLAALTAASAACTTPVRDIRRSALVPHPAPINRTGQTMGQNLFEGSLQAETLARSQAPTVADDTEGIALPKQQYRIGGRFRLPHAEHVDFGASYQRTLAHQADSLVDQPVPDEDGHALSTTVHASFPAGDSDFRVGLAIQATMHSIPYLIYQSCVSGCASPYRNVDARRSLTPGIAGGVHPSYKVGPITVHGGFSARTHPTIDRREFVVGYDADEGSPEVGVPVLILSAGIEAELPHGFRAGLVVHQTTANGPASYAPTAAATLSIPFVRSASPTAPRPRLAAQ